MLGEMVQLPKRTIARASAAMRPLGARPCWRRAASWSFILAFNLPLPFMLGLSVASTAGSIGICVAVLVCWGIGLLVSLASPRVESVLFHGGLAVAVVQFLFIPHMAAGLFGILVWEQIVGKPKLRDEDWSGGIAGFAITLLTAQPLLLAAWLFGGGLRVFFGSGAVKADDAADYGDHAESGFATKIEQG